MTAALSTPGAGLSAAASQALPSASLQPAALGVRWGCFLAH
jgi:hypothetical protein